MIDKNKTEINLMTESLNIAYINYKAKPMSRKYCFQKPSESLLKTLFWLLWPIWPIMKADPFKELADSREFIVENVLDWLAEGQEVAHSKMTKYGKVRLNK